MGPFWSSPEKVDTIRLVFQWASILCGAIAIVFATRFSTLKKYADTEKSKLDVAEKTLLKDKIHETKNELDSTKEKLSKAEKGIAKLIKVDASKATQYVKLPASGKFTYIKLDNSANSVIITPSVKGQTFAEGLENWELSLQNSSITLELSGTKWFRVQ